MKKKTIVFCCFIISLAITMFFSKIFSIYSFENLPTITTLFYMIAMFFIVSYIILLIVYIVGKKIKKEKIGTRKIIGMILFFISLMLVLGLVIILDVDYLNWYNNSTPFYVDVIVRCLEFLLPSILISVLGFYLSKNKK